MNKKNSDDGREHLRFLPREEVPENTEEKEKKTRGDRGENPLRQRLSSLLEAWKGFFLGRDENDEAPDSEETSPVSVPKGKTTDSEKDSHVSAPKGKTPDSEKDSHVSALNVEPVSTGEKAAASEKEEAAAEVGTESSDSAPEVALLTPEEPAGKPEEESLEPEKAAQAAEEKAPKAESAAEAEEPKATKPEESADEATEAIKSESEPEKKDGGEALPAPTAPGKGRLAAFLPMRPGARGENRLASRSADLLLVLLPLTVWGIYLFGFRVLTLTCLSVLSCFLFRFLAALLFRESYDGADLIPAVTGMLLALCLPPTAPLWMPVVGALIAVVLADFCAGRLSEVRLHPVAVAVASLFLISPSGMNLFCEPGTKLSVFGWESGFTGPTVSTAARTLFEGNLPKLSIGGMFVGLRAGTVGEVSALLILMGAVYLLYRKILRPGLFSSFLLTVAILSYLFPALAIASDMIALRFAVYQLLSGNLLFCAVFLTAEGGSLPRTGRGALAAGVIGGVAAFLIRRFIGPGIGPLCAVMILNLLSRPLDLLLKPSPFGGKVRRPRKEEASDVGNAAKTE